MRHVTAVAASLCAALIFIQPAPAQSALGAEPAPFPELQPDPHAPVLAATAEPLSIEQIVEAAVAFSGTAKDPGAAAESILAHAREFRSRSKGITDQRRLAEMALEYLHERVLSRYAVMATSIDDAVRTGSYNCVSSAVLYAILARSAGLGVAAVRTRDHAFGAVMVEGTWIDVETTNVYGFDPGRKKEFTDSFGAVTGYTYVPPSNYRDRTSIGIKELLALILYNRSSEAGQAGRFREAINPAVSAFTLIGTADFRETMRIAISNYATSLAMQEDFHRALEFLDAVQSSWGADPDLARLRMEVTHNFAVSLVEDGSLDEARALLETPAARSALGEDDWKDLSVYLVQTRAEAVSRRPGEPAAANAASADAAAADVVASGLKELGPEPELLRSYEAYMHNAFARMFNARRFDDARAILARGLAVHPSSATFARDMASLTAHR